MKVNCRHCLTLTTDESGFCCSACSLAFHLIQEANLDQFYQIPNRESPKPQESQSRFEVFDHPDFLDLHAPLKNAAPPNTSPLNMIREAKLYISGLHCASCVWLIERLPKLNSACLRSEVNFANHQIRLQFRGSLASIARTLSQLGYELSPQEKTQRTRVADWLRLGVTGASAMGAMHIGLLFLAATKTGMESSDARSLSIFLLLAALPALTYGSWPFFRQAWNSIKFRHLHPDVLISLAVISGTGLSIYNTFILGGVETYLDALATVVFLLLVARLLISTTLNQIHTQSSWKRSWKVTTTEGLVIPISSLKVGSRIALALGEIAPARARILSAETEWDTSVLTGEPWPRAFKQNQVIEEGFRNLGERVEIEILSEPQLQKWDDLIEVNPAESSTRDQIFSWIILGLAVAIGFATASFEMAFSVLIVSCPCAWLLARPLALVRFRNRWVEKGILVFRLPKIWNWANAKRIIFDKTGTLTQGFPRVLDFQTHDSEIFFEYRSSFLELLKASRHPLSVSLERFFCEANHTEELETNTDSIPSFVSNAREVPGQGLFGEVGTDTLSIRKSEHRQTDISSSLFVNEREIATVRFEDPVREEAYAAIKLLKALNTEIEILSGDQKGSLENFLEKSQLSVLVDRSFGELSPHEKAAHIKEASIYVGDGLNDLDAMSKAEASLGLIGSAESNFERADAYLIKKDLRLIPDFIEEARALQRHASVLEYYAYAYNLLAIALVLLGFLGPIICAILMPLSSISVAILAWRQPQSRKSRSPQRETPEGSSPLGGGLVDLKWGVLSKLQNSEPTDGKLLPSLWSHASRFLSRVSP